MAAGNSHLGYKEALNAHRGDVAGHEGDFYFGVPRSHRRPLRGRDEAAQDALAHVPRAAARRRRARCARSAGSSSGPRPCRGASEREPAAARAGRARCCSSTARAGSTSSSSSRAASSTPTPGIVPHDDLHRAARGRDRPVDHRRALHRDAADADRLRAAHAARRAGDLSEGPRARSCCSPTSSPGVRVFETRRRLRRAVDDAAARRRDVIGYELREDFAERARRRTSTSFLGEDARVRYRSRCATATRASTCATSTASCSTSPSRGRS